MADDAEDILKQQYGPQPSPLEQYGTHGATQFGPFGKLALDPRKLADLASGAWGMVSAPFRAAADITQNYRPGPENEVVNQDIGRQAFDAGSVIMGGSVAPRPAGSLGTFAGVRARNANMDKLAQAKQMAEAGEAMGPIRDATGWHQGPDGRWRWEISDDKMDYHPGRYTRERAGFDDPNVPTETARENYRKMSDEGWNAQVKDVMTHPELFANYPELAEAPFRVVPKDKLPEAWGTWGGLEGGATIRADVAPNLLSGKRTTAHEVMGHGPQGIEGFDTGASSKMYELSTPEIESFQRMAARTEDAKFIHDIMQKKNLQLVDAVGYIRDELGGRIPIESVELASQYARPEMLQRAADFYRERLRNAADPKNAYHRTTGEVEARNVADERLFMTPEERAEPTNAPWHTQGVKYEDQIRSPIRKATPEPEPGSPPGMSASEPTAKDILEQNYGAPRVQLEPAIRLNVGGQDRIFTGVNHGIAYDNAVAELGEAEVGRLSGAMLDRARKPKSFKDLGESRRREFTDYMFDDSPVEGFVGPNGYMTRRQTTAEMNKRGADVPPDYPMTAEELDDVRKAKPNLLLAGGDGKAAAGVAAKDILEGNYGAPMPPKGRLSDRPIVDPRMDPRLEQAAQLVDAPGRQRPFEAAMRVQMPDGSFKTYTGANHGIAYDNAIKELGEAEVGRLTGDMLRSAHIDGSFPAKKGYDPLWQDSPVEGFVGPDGYLTRSQATAAMNKRGATVEPTYAMTSEDLADIRAARPDLLFAGGNRKAAAGVAAKDILEEQYGKGAKPVDSAQGNVQHADMADDYRGQHGAPDRESGSPIHDVTSNGIYPGDFYGAEGLRYYGTGDDALDRLAYDKIRQFKGKPDEMVPIYRAIPAVKGKPKGVTLGKDYINPGDWVAITRQYAVDHGDSALNGNYHLVKRMVPARELYTAGDSFHEWGWDPSKP